MARQGDPGRGLRKNERLDEEPGTRRSPKDPNKNPMPFDGTRLIFGGFEPIVEV
jgi:hypothetical protein